MNTLRPYITIILFSTCLAQHTLAMESGVNGRSLGLVGKADQFFRMLQHNIMPIGGVLITGVTWYVTKEYDFLSKKISKWFSVMHNKLRGGSNLKEAQRLAGLADTVRFKDIFGQHEIIRYFQLLVDYLENPEPLDRLGLTPPKGILCIGDTRTGKTFAISALMGEIKEMFRKNGRDSRFKLFSLGAADVKDMGGIQKILAVIENNAPCILFIDELDLLGLQRIGGSGNDPLSEFLICMNSKLNAKDSKNQVIIIAATNRPENIDQALRQPGRFGKELRFEYPNRADRMNFIKHKLEKLSLDESQFDVEKLADSTENRSYEALTMLINNALLKARLHGDMITQAYIDETLNEDLRHIIPSNTKRIPDHERKILAAHFAGQALALTLLNGYTKLATATIKQVMTDLKEEAMGIQLFVPDKKDQKRFEYGRIFTARSQDSVGMSTKEEKLNMCKFYLAGFAAEELLLGTCGYGCHAEDDKGNALVLAQSVAFQGIDVAKLPKALQVKKHEEALALLEQCRKEITDLLSRNKAMLAKISDELEKQETIDAAQIHAFMNPTPPTQQA